MNLKKNQLIMLYYKFVNFFSRKVIYSKNYIKINKSNKLILFFTKNKTISNLQFCKKVYFIQCKV